MPDDDATFSQHSQESRSVKNSELMLDSIKCVAAVKFPTACKTLQIRETAPEELFRVTEVVFSRSKREGREFSLRDILAGCIYYILPFSLGESSVAVNASEYEIRKANLIALFRSLPFINYPEIIDSNCSPCADCSDDTDNRCCIREYSDRALAVDGCKNAAVLSAMYPEYLNILDAVEKLVEISKIARGKCAKMRARQQHLCSATV